MVKGEGLDPKETITADTEFNFWMRVIRSGQVLPEDEAELKDDLWELMRKTHNNLPELLLPDFKDEVFQTAEERLEIEEMMRGEA